MRTTMLDMRACYEFMQAADAAIQAIPDTMQPGVWAAKRDYIIAGGATRDTLLQRTVADIDVVIEPDTLHRWDVPWRSFPDDYSDGFITHTAKVLGPGNHPINLLVRNSTIWYENIANYHAVGLSNAFWLDGNLILHKTFMRSVDENKLLINKRRVGTPGLKEYVKKIMDKFPAWGVEIVEWEGYNFTQDFG